MVSVYDKIKKLLENEQDYPVRISESFRLCLIRFFDRVK